MGQLAKTRTRDTGSDKSNHSTASSVTDRAKTLFHDQLAARQEKSASALTDAARALELTSHSLGGNMLVPYVEKLSEQLKRAADFVRTADPATMSKSVEEFARKEPLLFLGGAALVGLVGGRFIKASGGELANMASSSSSSKASKSGSSHGAKKRPVAQA